MPEREWVYTLAFESPAGVFTGLGVAGLVDRTVLRGSDGLPVIPGSTVKGRLRFFAERLLRSGLSPDGCRFHLPDEPQCKSLERACTVCRLFGNPSIPALLRVGPASPAAPWDRLLKDVLAADRNPVVHADVEIRPGLAVSRVRRTALGDHLFFNEAVPASITFSGRLRLDSEVSEREERFLIGAAGAVDALGARKGAGRGRLHGGISIEPAGTGSAG